jgi:hypothetical protein
LGTFISYVDSKDEEGLISFTGISVKIDLSMGLLNKIILEWKGTNGIRIRNTRTLPSIVDYARKRVIL